MIQVEGNPNLVRTNTGHISANKRAVEIAKAKKAKRIREEARIVNLENTISELLKRINRLEAQISKGDNGT